MLGTRKQKVLLTLEKDLIAAAQQGSVGAFEQLINQMERKMLSLAAGLATTPDEAEDIYQEAMLSAFKAMPKFRLESQFSTWLYRIVVNTAISSRRKLKNKLSRLIVTDRSSYDDNIDHKDMEHYGLPGSGLAANGLPNNPEAELMNEQLNRAIAQAVASLSDKERIAFVLCHQQDVKIFEAAQVMDCQEGTVKSYLFRAREKMREQLQAYRH